MSQAVTRTHIVMKSVNTPDVFRWETPEISLTVSGGATPNAESEAIDVRGMVALAMTVDHNRTGSSSTSLDAQVFTSYDGSKWDTETYHAVNLGAAKVKSIPISSGIAYLKIKAVNNDASNATKVKLVLMGSR